MMIAPKRIAATGEIQGEHDESKTARVTAMLTYSNVADDSTVLR